MLFNIVGKNQKISTKISNKTDRKGLSENIHKIIDNIQKIKENESPLDIFLFHFLKEINAMKKHKNATNQILKAQIQALSYIWIVKIIKEISHHINQETMCGFVSPLTTLLK